MTDLPISHYAERIDRAHRRLDDVEGRVGRLETADAVAVERDKHIQASLTKIELTLSRLAWLVVTALAGGVLTWVVQGGLFRGQ